MAKLATPLWARVRRVGHFTDTSLSGGVYPSVSHTVNIAVRDKITVYFDIFEWIEENVDGSACDLKPTDLPVAIQAAAEPERHKL